MDLLLVLSTFPDEERARQIGTLLVEKQLAACVNLISGLTSIYRWEGGLESAGEVLAVFKTSKETYPHFEKELRALHPYEVPEIIALEAKEVAAAYGQWVLSELRR